MFDSVSDGGALLSGSRHPGFSTTTLVSAYRPPVSRFSFRARSIEPEAPIPCGTGRSPRPRPDSPLLWEGLSSPDSYCGRGFPAPTPGSRARRGGLGVHGRREAGDGRRDGMVPTTKRTGAVQRKGLVPCDGLVPLAFPFPHNRLEVFQVSLEMASRASTSGQSSSSVEAPVQ